MKRCVLDESMCCACGGLLVHQFDTVSTSLATYSVSYQILTKSRVDQCFRTIMPIIQTSRIVGMQAPAVEMQDSYLHNVVISY